MKMETVIKAPKDCEIEKIYVAEGETVKPKQLLIKLKDVQ
jgi:biotin carboxyl carrier protein